MVARDVDFAARAMDGRVLAGDPARRWHGAAIDSRRVTGGEIFFALPGARVDGHDFAAAAAGRGAAAVVVHRQVEAADAAVIRVEDTTDALHALTREVRRAVPRQLVAITGSVGKTTTKELLAAFLARRFPTGKSPGNLNNLYGFPLALLDTEDGCEWMVAEMGMSTPGELGAVSRLGRPDVAVYTNVRPVHLESFADLRAIAEAKAELLEGLRADGLVVANADDPEVMRIAERWHAAHPAGRLVRYGFGGEAEVRGTPPEPRSGGTGLRFEMSVGGETAGLETAGLETAGLKTVTLELSLHGLYNAANVLAAAACAHALGVPLAEIRSACASLPAEGFNATGAAGGRGRIRRAASGVVVVDDTYNSNPEAAVRALESARELPARRRVAVLGDMLELGPQSEAFHREVGAKAVELGFELVIGVGELARALAGAAAGQGAVTAHFSDAQRAAAGLPSAVRPGDVVLVKGSRGVGLEVVVDALCSSGEAA